MPTVSELMEEYEIIDSPEQQGATWADVATSVLSPERWYHSVGKGFGGVGRIVEEAIGVEDGPFRVAADAHSKALEESQIRIDKDDWGKEIVYGAGESLRQMLVPLAMGVAGRIPAAAAYLSGEVGGTEAQDLREAGFTTGQAAAGGLGYAAAELAGEAVSLPFLFGKGVSKEARRGVMDYLFGAGKYLGAEYAGEGFTETVQAGIDKLTTQPDMTMEDFADRLYKMLGVVTLSAPAMHVGGTMAKDYYRKQLEDSGEIQSDADRSVAEVAVDSFEKYFNSTPASILTRAAIDNGNITPDQAEPFMRMVLDNQKISRDSGMKLDEAVLRDIDAFDEFYAAQVATPTAPDVTTDEAAPVATGTEMTPQPQQAPPVEGIDPDLGAAIDAPVGTTVDINAATDGVVTNAPLTTQQTTGQPSPGQPVTPAAPTSVQTPPISIGENEGIVAPPVEQVAPAPEPVSIPEQLPSQPQNIFDTIKEAQVAGNDVSMLVDFAKYMGLQVPAKQLINNLENAIENLRDLFSRFGRAGRPIYLTEGEQDVFKPQFGTVEISSDERRMHELAHAGANEALNADDLELFLRWIAQNESPAIRKAIDSGLHASEALAILYDDSRGKSSEFNVDTAALEGIFQKIDAAIQAIQNEGAGQEEIATPEPVAMDERGRGPIIESPAGRTNLRRIDAPEEVLARIREADKTQNAEAAQELDTVVLAIEAKLDEIKTERKEGRPVNKLMAELEKLRKRERELRKQLKPVNRSGAVKAIVDFAKQFGTTPQDVNRMLSELGVSDPEGVLVAIDEIANQAAADAQAAHTAYQMNPSQEARYNFEVALARFLSLRKLAKGKIREYARALNFLGERRGVSAGAVTNYAAALDALNQEFSALNIGEVTEKALAMGEKDFNGLTGKKVDQKGGQKARPIFEPTWRDKLYQYWINSILSAPTTQFANIFSNTSILPLRIIEEFGSDVQKAGVSKASQLGWRNTATMLKTMLEISPIFGDGETFKKIWAGELKIEGDVSKVEFDQKSAIPLWMQFPTRMLETMDTYFKLINHRMSINGEAIRIAQSENLQGAAFDARVNELVENPTTDMMDKATADAKYYTFTNELDEMGRYVSKFRDMKVGKGTAYEFQPGTGIVPFLRTPWNIAKFAFDRTPVKLALNLVNSYKGIVREDGTVDYPSAKEWSQAAVGTTIMMTAYALAQAGFITGSGPEDKRDRNNLRNTGWQPYAFYFPGTGYVQYSRIEPFGALLGFAADMSENKGKGISMVGQVIKAIGTNFADKTFLKSANDLFDAFKQPDQKAQYFIQRQIGGLIPNIIAQTARATDPYLRQTEGYAEYMQSRIPGASNLLLPRLDQWGREVDRTGDIIQPFSTLLRLGLPMGVTADRGNKVDEELARLNIKVGMPSDKLRFRDQVIEMTPEEFHNYIQVSGSEARKQVERIMTSRMPDKMKEKAVLKAVEKSRKRWRDAYLRKSR